MELILASASPRRKEILQQAGYTFQIKTSDVDEHIEEVLTPAELVIRLAKMKASAVAKDYPKQITVGADTVVYLDGNVLGKPLDEAHAVSMLSELSGRTHTVYTGVALCCPAKKIIRTFYQQTDVTFYPLTDEEIAAYVATREPMDKAGAYGIQGRGCILIKEINGDFYNVVGFPIAEFSRELDKMCKEIG